MAQPSIENKSIGAGVVIASSLRSTRIGVASPPCRALVVLMTMNSSGGPFNGVNFSSADHDFERLENIVERLSKIRTKEHPQLRTVRRNKLIFYDYERQPLHRTHIVVAQSLSICSFPVRMPTDPPYKGNYNLTLDWTELRLPQHREVVDGLVSDEIIRGGYYEIPRPGQIADLRQERIPRFRVNREHQLIVQVKEDSFIQSLLFSRSTA